VSRQTRLGRSAWQWGLIGCAVLIGLTAPALAAAQAPPALKGVVSDPPPKGAEALGQFETQYRAAHSPRILLFWNVSFDDETRSTEAAVEITESTGLEKGGSSDTPAQVRASFNTSFDPAKQHPHIAPREEAMLESAFRQSLHERGVRLLDRAASLRFTAAELDREGADPKLIESDAVKGNADILLEILMVKDFDSALGRGFKVIATQVSTGEEITSFYTRAQPPAPLRTGRYVGTDEGFKWQSPTPWVPPVDQVGRTLAEEVMITLARAFGAAPTSASPGARKQ
jgi:hypothetical protein